MANTSPAALLADSLASLSKSAHLAFAEIESKARSEVARAASDAQEARNERDKALDAQHTYQLEGQVWKQEVINCKASLKQAEISIAHQTETIAQLRREANQWKDQSRNWQEHFLRVEQERCRLSSRVDELVAERLQWARRFDVPTPLTPHHHFLNASDSAPSSTTTKRGSTSSFNVPPSSKSARPASSPQLDSPITSISAHKQMRSQTKPVKFSRTKAEASPLVTVPQPTQRSERVSARSPKRTPVEMRQTIIRRVHAVINVKQEEDDDVLDSDPKEIQERDHRTGAGISSRKRRKVVPQDDDDYDENEDGHRSPVEDATDEPGNDDSEGENVTGDGSDDDELMLGAEDNHHEVYGTRRVKTMKNILHESEALPADKKRKTAESRREKKPPATVRRGI